MNNKNKYIQKSILLFVGIISIAVLFWALRQLWPVVGIDWKETFFPAARAVLQGKSPYSVPTFRNAPWTILPLLPFAAMSEEIGGMVFFIVSLGVYAWTAYRLKASRIALIVFLLSPPVVYGMRMLNVDILVLFGFTLPAPLGLFFVIIKPQMGIVMGLFWLVEAWQQGGIKSVIRTFTPITIALVLSFVLFGNWISGRQADLFPSTWNASLWPWALPIGIVLVALSVRDGRKDLAMSASPFLSPYLAYHSWASVMAGLIRHDFELVIVVIGMWLVAVIRAMGF
ncbi:MAG: hypothetical protein ABIJ39_01035 [Chloroflexota bacterium]